MEHVKTSFNQFVPWFLAASLNYGNYGFISGKKTIQFYQW
jgi:hypothetical protein